GHALGGPLGMGGAGGFSASGSGAWLTAVRTRGEAGATGVPGTATDTAPWGGAITFTTTENWYFGSEASGLGPGQNDFLSVATHELIHLLGFNNSNGAFA